VGFHQIPELARVLAGGRYRKKLPSLHNSGGNGEGQLGEGKKQVLQGDVCSERKRLGVIKRMIFQSFKICRKKKKVKEGRLANAEGDIRCPHRQVYVEESITWGHNQRVKKIARAFAMRKRAVGSCNNSFTLQWFQGTTSRGGFRTASGGVKKAER